MRILQRHIPCLFMASLHMTAWLRCLSNYAEDGKIVSPIALVIYLTDPLLAAVAVCYTNNCPLRLSPNVKYPWLPLLY